MKRVLFVLIILLAFSSAAWAQKGDPTPISKIDIPDPCADYKPCLQELPGKVEVKPGRGKVPPIEPAPITGAQAAKPGPVSLDSQSLGHALIKGGAVMSLGRGTGAAHSAEQETRRSLKRLIKELG